MQQEKVAENVNYSSHKKKIDPEKIKSINDALHVLNSAASEAGEEIRHIISDDFKQLKNVFEETGPTIRESLRSFKERTVGTINSTRDGIKDYSKEQVKNIDHKAHDNPWYFMAGCAATSILLGFALGRKTKNLK